MMRIPQHILLMPDGDRRFARREHLPHNVVYEIAAERARRFVGIALEEFGIKTVSIFLTRPATLSRAVQARGAANLIAIFDAIADLARKLPKEPALRSLSIEYQVVGIVSTPPPRIKRSGTLLLSWRRMVSALDELTAADPKHRNNSAERAVARVNLLVNYSGRAALLKIIRGLHRVGGQNMLTISSTFAEELGGPVGLVVRTAGAMRMSDGPCHQMFQASVVQVDRLFPELSDNDVRRCLAIYFNRRAQSRR